MANQNLSKINCNITKNSHDTAAPTAAAVAAAAAGSTALSAQDEHNIGAFRLLQSSSYSAKFEEKGLEFTSLRRLQGQVSLQRKKATSSVVACSRGGGGSPGILLQQPSFETGDVEELLGSRTGFDSPFLMTSTTTPPGVRRTVSTSALRLHKKSLFWKRL